MISTYLHKMFITVNDTQHYIFSQCFSSVVTPPAVLIERRVPLGGRELKISVHEWNLSAMNERGVQLKILISIIDFLSASFLLSLLLFSLSYLEWSASGIHFLFIGVSRVTGRMATTVTPSGRPESYNENLSLAIQSTVPSQREIWSIDERQPLPFRIQSYQLFHCEPKSRERLA